MTPASDDEEDSEGGSSDEEDEEEEVEEEYVDGVGMSESEERLVASFMNAGTACYVLIGPFPLLCVLCGRAMIV